MKCCSMALVGGWLVVTLSYATEPVSDMPDDPVAYVTTTYDGETDLDLDGMAGSGGRVRFWESEAYVSAPLATNAEWVVALGGSLSWTRLEFENLPEIGDSLDLYGIGVPLDLLHTGIERWTLWAQVMPAAMSDFRHVTADDYRVLASGLALYQYSPRLQVAAGAAYNREFGRDLLYPVGGVQWDPGARLRVSLMIPRPAITYLATDRLLLFAEARPAGSMWNIHVPGEDADSDLKLETWRLGAGAEYRLAGACWISLAAGADIMRHYELHSGDDPILDADAEDTWFARLGFAVR